MIMNEVDRMSLLEMISNLATFYGLCEHFGTMHVQRFEHVQHLLNAERSESPFSTINSKKRVELACWQIYFQSGISSLSSPV